MKSASDIAADILADITDATLVVGPVKTDPLVPGPFFLVASKSAKGFRLHTVEAEQASVVAALVAHARSRVTLHWVADDSEMADRCRELWPTEYDAATAEALAFARSLKSQ